MRTIASKFAIAAAAEKDSLHPLAGAIVKFARDNGAEPLDSETAITVPGKGLSAKVEERHVLLGSRPFMEENGVNVTEGDEAYSKFTKNGATAIFLAVDKKLAAIFESGLKRRSAA
ncbi:MAG: hypothetical protein IH986_10910 [Planctomycetes bacterium]|nr:hypothetical protein [Planctomycetota bacterium]